MEEQRRRHRTVVDRAQTKWRRKKKKGVWGGLCEEGEHSRADPLTRAHHHHPPSLRENNAPAPGGCSARIPKHRVLCVSPLLRPESETVAVYR